VNGGGAQFTRLDQASGKGEWWCSRVRDFCIRKMPSIPTGLAVVPASKVCKVFGSCVASVP
jgi:hypothetical protein